MSQTNPLKIAGAIVCALLFVVGLLLIALGSYGYVHRNEAVLNMESQLRSDYIRGQFHNDIEKSADMDMARVMASADRARAMELLGAGTVLVLPLIVSGALTRRANRMSP